MFLLQFMYITFCHLADTFIGVGLMLGTSATIALYNWYRLMFYFSKRVNDPDS